MLASCWVARKIFLSPAMASSRARTLDSRPTTNGVIMYGKITTSRIGIMGRRFVSDFSFEVSMKTLGGSETGGHAFACPSHDEQARMPILHYPAFSNSVRLIFCESTISLVTWNSRTFLYDGK